uniref:XPG N-terminal domain-containing protein n=1 Tax=viral metagenome TaxID=1070528 RepID=A0A6C0IHH1_9ZZZZ
MGIKHLNRFLRNECSDSIKFVSIAELSGKKIAVDISIYMYKFHAENALIENIYLMLSIFRHYKITPIFVFDGKSPTEKKALLEKRRADKKEAEKQYNKLKKELAENKDIDEADKQEIISNMDLLKKQFVYITRDKIDEVKDLIRAYGATYYDALGEADELCAQLVINNKVWACLSEDMDMFVYGCQRVIRYISLLNHTIVLYDNKEILNTLQMTQQELREICVISGTDYNMYSDNKNTHNLQQTLKLFYRFKKQKEEPSFYEWLLKNTSYIEDYELLKNIYDLFDLKHCNMENVENIKIVNGPIVWEEINNILQTDGFLFPSKV